MIRGRVSNCARVVNEKTAILPISIFPPSVFHIRAPYRILYTTQRLSLYAAVCLELLGLLNLSHFASAITSSLDGREGLQPHQPGCSWPSPTDILLSSLPVSLFTPPIARIVRCIRVICLSSPILPGIGPLNLSSPLPLAGSCGASRRPTSISKLLKTSWLRLARFGRLVYESVAREPVGHDKRSQQPPPLAFLLGRRL